MPKIIKHKPRYRYDKVICERVIDGDTIDVIIDLGFDIQKKERLRLYRVDTPEIRGKTKEEGLKAKDYVENEIRQESKVFSIETFKKGKFGRMLANILIGQSKQCLNDKLVERGLAVYKDY